MCGFREFHPSAQGRHIEDISALSFTHIGPKEAAKTGYGHNVEHDHSLNLLRRGVTEGVEKEKAGVIDEDVYGEALLYGIIVHRLCGIRLGKVQAERPGPDPVGKAYLLCGILQLLLLIGNHEDVTGIIPCEND